MLVLLCSGVFGRWFILGRHLMVLVLVVHVICVSVYSIPPSRCISITSLHILIHHFKHRFPHKISVIMFLRKITAYDALDNFFKLFQIKSMSMRSLKVANLRCDISYP